MVNSFLQVLDEMLDDEIPRLLARAKDGREDLIKACKKILALPAGTPRINGHGFTKFEDCNLRRKLFMIHWGLAPDKLRGIFARYPSLESRRSDFEQAGKILNNAWDVLEPLILKQERANAANGNADPGTPPGTNTRGSASGGRGRGRGRGRARRTGDGDDSDPDRAPSPPPPMGKTPVEIFLSIDSTAPDQELLPIVLSVTSFARQRPRAKTRRYVELDEQRRKQLALHVINEATPHLLELASMGRVGEFAYACEIGEKERKHHGQGAVEVFTSGAADMASDALKALLEACFLENEAGSQVHDVHDKGENRSKEEAIGYALKDMPSAMMPDGTVHPRAIQGQYYARPKVFCWRGNLSDERAEECIEAYRKNNQYTGGPNFHKTGFAYGNGSGHKARSVIGLKNLMTWPVTYGRKHGWLELAGSFMKLLCLMFEDGEYELGLELIDKSSTRPEARIEALHKLNMNCAYASTTSLMKKVVCGLAQFEEASAAFLVTFRPKWRLTLRIAEEMDRAEFVRYVATGVAPVRLSYCPQSSRLPSSELRGAGFVVDLNTGMGYNGGLEVIACMDEMRLFVSTRCMYEHMHLHDAEGYVSCGFFSIVVTILENLMLSEAAGSESFFSSFLNFIRLEINTSFFIDVNTGEFRDIVDRFIVAATPACAADCILERLLTTCLQTPSADVLGSYLHTRVIAYMSPLSVGTVVGLIRDSVSPKAGAALHMAIVHGARDAACTMPLPPKVPGDMQHHFLAVWATNGAGHERAD
jgi:hypothetical protein